MSSEVEYSRMLLKAGADAFVSKGDDPVWMLAHSSVHGMVVGLILDPVLGLAEATSHFYVDCGKCNNKYGMWIDQWIHLILKIVWMVIYFYMIKNVAISKIGPLIHAI